MKVHMTGSEWFSTRAGGLNRYFQDLFQALRVADGVEVTAAAFGPAPGGGASWGEGARSTFHRWRQSNSRVAVPPGALLDRHFALYGPSPARPPKGSSGFVIHFQGPWWRESRVGGASQREALAKRAVETFRYWRADLAVVLCDEFRELLAEDFAFPRDRIVVIPPGVDLDRFRPAERDASDEAPMVLCVRRLEHRMGIDVLLRAWADVVRQQPAQLAIVGEGTLSSELRQLTTQMGLNSSVTFHGRLSDEKLNDLYASATVSVVPTRALEGFGLIALESLASGCPVIVTRTGGLPDAVRGLDPSLVVDVENPDALGARILDALKGDRPSADLCRAHAETFSWARVAADHLDLYSRLGR